jgi:hypothetical protein
MFGEVLRRWKASGVWVKAKQLSSSGRYAEALELVRYGDETSRRKLHWRLFEIHQLGLLKNYVGALEQAKAFIADLSAKPNLSADERYFLAFAQWYGQIAFLRLHASQSVPPELEFDLRSFALGDVDPRWKRAFPMLIHPEWDDSKPAAKQGLSR